ncbi:hypothetical protein KC323_g140 [Hortaea werneckii]|nr:hypothetical protein KC323_g140 [Hortaea werneckii]
MRLIEALALNRTIMELHQDYFEERPVSSMHPPIEYKHFIELCDEIQETQEPTKDLWDPLTIERRKASQRAKAHQKRKAGSDEEENEKPSSGARERGPDEIFRQMFEARMHCVHPDLVAHAKYGESIWVSAEEYDRAQMAAEKSWRDSDGVTNEMQATRGAIFEDYQAEEQTAGDVNNEYRRASYLRNHQERRDHFRRHLRSKRDGYMSDKIGPIVEIIRQAREDTSIKVSQITDMVSKKTHLANAKTIVIAEHLSQLDLLGVALEDELRIQPLRYDGSCTADERRQVIEEHEEIGKDFSKPWVEPSKRTVLLATKESCAEGPNLPHTTTVVFIAPFWNPFMMDQCKGKVCCLTNRNQVSVHYFNCINSMEMLLVESGDFKRESVNGVNDKMRLRRGFHDFSSSIKPRLNGLQRRRWWLALLKSSSRSKAWQVSSVLRRLVSPSKLNREVVIESRSAHGPRDAEKENNNNNNNNNNKPASSRHVLPLFPNLIQECPFMFFQDILQSPDRPVLLFRGEAARSVDDVETSSRQERFLRPSSSQGLLVWAPEHDLSTSGAARLTILPAHVRSRRLCRLCFFAAKFFQSLLQYANWRRGKLRLGSATCGKGHGYSVEHEVVIQREWRIGRVVVEGDPHIYVLFQPRIEQCKVSLDLGLQFFSGDFCIVIVIVFLVGSVFLVRFVFVALVVIVILTSHNAAGPLMLLILTCFLPVDVCNRLQVLLQARQHPRNIESPFTEGGRWFLEVEAMHSRPTVQFIEVRRVVCQDLS